MHQKGRRGARVKLPVAAPAACCLIAAAATENGLLLTSTCLQEEEEEEEGSPSLSGVVRRCWTIMKARGRLLLTTVLYLKVSIESVQYYAYFKGGKFLVGIYIADHVFSLCFSGREIPVT